MAIEIRTATEADLPGIFSLDARAFFVEPSEEDLATDRATLDLDRFVVALDPTIEGTDGTEGIVGVAGSHQLELTLPGGAALPMAGVAWVSVSATHRRQGLLTRMMAWLDDRAAENGEPLLGLTASEGPIYERFGYGVATRTRIVEIDRRRTQIADPPPPGSVHIVDARGREADVLERFERYRTTQPGEITRNRAKVIQMIQRSGKQPWLALHDNGFALWTTEAKWNNSHPAHEVFVHDLVAADDDALVALWHTVLSIDMAGPIRSFTAVAHDSPLPYLLTDGRALRTVEANDMLWLKVTDPARAFGARSYRSDDRLVVAIPDRPALAVSADDVHPAEGVEPDLHLQPSAVGPLLLGGVTATQLARGRRLTARNDGILERADAFFGTGRLPHLRTGF